MSVYAYIYIYIYISIYIHIYIYKCVYIYIYGLPCILSGRRRLSRWFETALALWSKPVARSVG